jgi:SSS family solute:Na+ symporter
MIQFHWLDWAIVALYAGFLLFVTFYGLQRHKQDDNNYILAGRKLTLTGFVASLVSTWYGGILGVGEFTYLYGLSNWFVFGLPYYLYAILMAYWLAPKIRASGFLTLPDHMRKHYGQNNATITAFLLFLLTIPAPYLLMNGLLIRSLTDLSLEGSMIIGGLFSLIYVYKGGFRNIVRSDKLQFIFMFAGFVLLFITLNTAFFPFWQLPGSLPASHLEPTGGNSWGFILAWYIIAAQTLIDPNFYQRIYAAESPSLARSGILVSIVLWMVFDLLTTTTGLYAKVLLSPETNPANAFIALGDIALPPLLKGIFFTGLLATVMSTLDSFAFVSAISLSRDFLSRVLTRRQVSIRLALIIVTTLSVILAIALPSIISLWYMIGSLVMPVLLPPLLFSFFTRVPIRKDVVLGGILGAFVLALTGIALQHFFPKMAGLGLLGEPIVVVLMVHFIYLGIFKRQKSVNPDSR